MRTYFQSCTASGASLLVSEPVVGRSSAGDHTYAFQVWLLRPAARDQLLQSVVFTSTAPVRLPSGAGGPALAAALLPAMALGLPLRVDAPVSPRFLEGVERLQRIFGNWFAHFHRIDVRAPAARVAPPRGEGARRTGAFFSAGVDGFYTVKRHLADLSALVFTQGFDIHLCRLDHRLEVERSIEAMAGDLGCEPVVLQSDYRSFSDPYCWWGHVGGSMLGACAQLLEGHLDCVLEASSTTVADFVPFGSTALTDPLFSTEGMEVVHDAFEVGRVDKVRDLAGWDYALQRLRVCWAMPETGLNCCACDKCLRTMTSLWLAGALERATTFNQPLDPARIAAHAVEPEHFSYVEDNLARARELGLSDAPVMRAWRTALARAAEAGGPATADALGAAIADEPFRAVWAKRHAPELLSDAARVAPDALLDELDVHAPGVADAILRAVLARQPGLLPRALARRMAEATRRRWQSFGGRR